MHLPRDHFHTFPYLRNTVKEDLGGFSNGFSSSPNVHEMQLAFSDFHSQMFKSHSDDNDHKAAPKKYTYDWLKMSIFIGQQNIKPSDICKLNRSSIEKEDSYRHSCCCLCDELHLWFLCRICEFEEN